MWNLNCKFPIVKNATQLIPMKIGVYLKHVRVSEYVMNHTGSLEQSNCEIYIYKKRKESSRNTQVAWSQSHATQPIKKGYAQGVQGDNNKMEVSNEVKSLKEKK